MPLTQRIQNQFQASVQSLTDAAVMLTEPLSQAVELVTASLMQEGKVLICGNGASALLGRHMAGILAQNLEQARPGLAALFLDPGATAFRNHAGIESSLARQVEALGHPGDVLCVISCYGTCGNLVRAVRVAHERGMRVVLLTGGDGGELAAMLGDEDVAVCAPTDSGARIVETQLLAIHRLCDGIDFFLLGA